jgi:molybdate transport system substrate-binding protein
VVELLNVRRAFFLVGSLLACLTLALAGLVACRDDVTTTSGATATGTSGVSGSITVFAAASLTDAFNEIAGAFRAANTGAEVTFNFGSSSTLATQINEAGGADVFASANDAQMKVVVDAGNASGPKTFATNVLVIAKPKGSTAVASFADLAKPGVRLVLAAPEVPVGQYAREAIKTAGDSGAYGADFEPNVLANLRSEEADVKATLAKAQLGEADAVIVYATDVLVAQEDVDSLEIPVEYNVVASYPIAVVSDSDQEALARAFVDFVLSPPGQAILAKYSFGPPPAP